MIESKILPFLGHKRVNEITALDILNWENELMAMRTSNGLEYSQTYLHSICNQLSAMLNHAVRYYGLESNPMAKVGKIGSKQADAMSFWTKEEYLRFSREVMDKPQSFITFELLYWCGLRLGEMLALTPAAFDFKNKRLSVTKSYQRMHREDAITAPKTPKSVRTIVMPSFLVDEVIDFMKRIPDLRDFDRLVPATKSFLHHEMDRGSKAAGVKRIRIHDLRHSHVSLLIELGYSALAIADRLGHESTEVTMRYAHLFPNKQEDMADDLGSKTIAFRMSQEEDALLDRLVSISGMMKQDYIISRLSDAEMKVVPSSRMQKGMEEAMLLIYRELLRVTDANDVSPELAKLTEKVSSIFAGLEEDELPARIASDENVIINLERDF